MDKGRTQQFARDDRLMAALTEINDMLKEVRRPDVGALQNPIVFVVGCPRSGTTLMMQWLATLGVFAYPSNLVARFYNHPYFGVRVQQMLHTYDSKQQIFPAQDSAGGFHSQYGHTTGALAPSEFWYFWRRFFTFGEDQWIRDFNGATQQPQLFARELAEMEAAFAMPLAMKGMILNWNLPELHALFDRCLMINVSRDDVDNAESLYFSRQNFFGDTSKWYSFKPPEYIHLKDLSPLEQVAGQVYYTKKAVSEGLKKIDSAAVLHVSHENFCRDPETVYRQMAEKLQGLGLVLPAYSGTKSFGREGKSRLSATERQVIVDALLRFSQETV